MHDNYEGGKGRERGREREGGKGREGREGGKYFTVRKSSGRLFPLSIPLFMLMNRSTVGLSFTEGLWRLVCSMMME